MTVEKFLSIAQDACRSGVTASLETAFDEAAFDSLDHVEFVIEVEDVFQISIPDDVADMWVKEGATLGDAWTDVQKISEKAATR